MKNNKINENTTIDKNKVAPAPTELKEDKDLANDATVKTGPYTKVLLDDKWVYIDKKGKIISNPSEDCDEKKDDEVDMECE